MATSSFFSIAGGDGSIQNDVAVSVSWDTVHDAATGTAGDGSETTMEAGADFTDRWFLKRTFIPFDTSAIPGNALIQSATVQLWVTATVNDDNDGDDFINIVGPTTQASSSSLGTADFDQCGAVNDPQELATRIDIGSLSTGQYNTWTLNATGLANITKGGITLFGAREGHDMLDNQPVLGTNEGTKAIFSSADNTGTSQDPILTVVFVVPAGGPMFFDGSVAIG